MRTEVAASEPRSLGVPARALIVDKCPTGRMVLKGILERGGFEVRFATDDQRVWRQIEHERIDALICDADDPEIDAIELARSVRSWVSRRIAIVLMTKESACMGRVEALVAGADDYVSKATLDAAALRARIGQLLGERGHQSRVH